MTARRRLDAELVRRSLARSRDHARELIEAGRVTVGGQAASKAATQVETAAAIVVLEPSDGEDYVSRGGHKLAGALAAFMPRGLTVAGRRCLDAGASTGGFTDVLLRNDAAHVLAVDVGYGQLAWPIQTDGRVTVMDRTNVRELTPDMLGGPVDLVVGDLSFISLRLVLPALAGCVEPASDLVMMVKPQFEVGRERRRTRAGRPRRHREPTAGAGRERRILPVAPRRRAAAERRRRGARDQGGSGRGPRARGRDRPGAGQAGTD